MRGALLGEFAGTFMMMFLGDGVVAACLLKHTKIEGGGWLVITTAWAFAVLCGIFTANLFGSVDAHLNPAITVAFAVKTGDFSKVLPYSARADRGELRGGRGRLALLPAVLEADREPGRQTGDLLHGSRHSFLRLQPVQRDHGDFRARHFSGFGELETRSDHGSGCGIESVPGGLSRLVDRAFSRLDHGLRHQSRRDFGPRLAHALLPIAGKGGSDWGYAWIPITGPVVGASLAGFVLRMLGA